MSVQAVCLNVGTPPDRGRYASASRNDGKDGIGKKQNSEYVLKIRGAI